MATSPRTQSAGSPGRARTGRRKAAGRSRRRRVNGSAAKVARDSGSIVSDIERLRDDLVRLSGSVSSLMTARAGAARDSATDLASDLYDTGLGYARDAEDQVRGMAGDLAKQVERNPLAAIGIVFGVGYIIGLMRRR